MTIPSLYVTLSFLTMEYGSATLGGISHKHELCIYALKLQIKGICDNCSCCRTNVIKYKLAIVKCHHKYVLYIWFCDNFILTNNDGHLKPRLKQISICWKRHKNCNSLNATTCKLLSTRIFGYSPQFMVWGYHPIWSQRTLPLKPTYCYYFSFSHGHL